MAESGQEGGFASAHKLERMGDRHSREGVVGGPALSVAAGAEGSLFTPLQRGGRKQVLD